MTTTRRRRRTLRFLLLAGLLFWLATHYLLLGLYLLPSNAISLLHNEDLGRYVYPFFTQNWRLFAPNPPRVRDRFLIQLNVQPVSDPHPRLSEWFDVTTPLVRDGWASPLSPALPRHRTIQGIASIYIASFANRTGEPRGGAVPADPDTVEAFSRLLTLLASELIDPEQYRLLAVRGRAVFEEIPPFSRLEAPVEPPGEVQSITFGWFPAAPAVTGPVTP